VQVSPSPTCLWVTGRWLPCPETSRPVPLRPLSLAPNHTAKSSRLASKNTDVNQTAHRVITLTKFELRRKQSTQVTEVDERNKAGERYSKKKFYTEVKNATKHKSIVTNL
jgi:hypothetical protein